ncbi:MAG: 16S rRNA (uracil(1498)-N(3))-methyltransferase [Planctomycetes bacterium]|nr:16S rRNA (uracil(1498)-N(3))-methyltransferase [Planctomycetota bacterium]
MNFLLLEPHELAADGRCELRGRRARHLREVLRAEVGQRLRAGVIDGDLGTAVVERLDDELAIVHAELQRAPAPVGDVLLLAVPRPKVLMRMLGHAAALGFARVVLFRSWRVDKSWMQSRAFDPQVQREQLVLGLEQAGRTRLPEVLHFDRFKPMVEDELPRLTLPELRFVAHPRGAVSTRALARMPDRPFALAVGPDGGFVDYEVDKLRERGFCPITLGPHALRTETALAALWGQLDLLRKPRSLPPA